MMIKVLRGNPHQVAEVADALEFEHKYTSGVIAWAAVQHREAGGGVHVHVLAARCDLETGKSLNIAAPGWQKTFDALRDWQNHENGWSRPDDPERGAGRATRPSGVHRGRPASGRGWRRRKIPGGVAARRIGQGLEAAARADRSAGQGFEVASRALEEGLQGDRRSVARGVNAIWKQQQQARERQRGPERDFGPSR